MLEGTSVVLQAVKLQWSTVPAHSGVHVPYSVPRFQRTALEQPRGEWTPAPADFPHSTCQGREGRGREREGDNGVLL